MILFSSLRRNVGVPERALLLQKQGTHAGDAVLVARERRHLRCAARLTQEGLRRSSPRLTAWRLDCADCCDGTDEYDGAKSCPNTCIEAGSAARTELKAKAAAYQAVRAHAPLCCHS